MSATMGKAPYVLLTVGMLLTSSLPTKLALSDKEVNSTFLRSSYNSSNLDDSSTLKNPSNLANLINFDESSNFNKSSNSDKSSSLNIRNNFYDSSDDNDKSSHFVHTVPVIVLSVIAVILVVVIVSCCVRKKGLSRGGSKTRSSSVQFKAVGSEGSDPEAQAGSPEYPYAYQHLSRAPVNDPDLDKGPELQEDHYYSQLKHNSSKKDTDETKTGKLGTRLETEQLGSGQEHKNKKFKVQPKDKTRDKNNGYEVVEVQNPGGVTPKPSNQGPPEAEAHQGDRDSGYEVLSVKPVRSDKHHSYVTLEPPTENQDSAYEDTTVKPVKSHSFLKLKPPAENRLHEAKPGYEKVTKIKQPERAACNASSPEYDHLQWPGQNLSKEGANSKM